MRRFSTRTGAVAIAFSFATLLPVVQAQAGQDGSGQASSTPATVSTATPAVTNSNTANSNAANTAEAPLQPPVRQGFWGRMNPFARKRYVEGQLAPIRDRVNELDGLTADNTKAIADVDTRAKAGIADAQERAQKADAAAQAAGQLVQQDETQAGQLNQQVAAAGDKMQNLDQYQVAQTAELQFSRGPVKLSTDAQQQLDGFLQGLDSEKGYVVEVTAYSNLKGNAAIANSQQLADAVVRYMVLQHNLPLYRIYTMGLGGPPAAANSAALPTAAPSAAAAAMHTTVGGTVDIKILRNSLASTSSAGSR